VVGQPPSSFPPDFFFFHSPRAQGILTFHLKTLTDFSLDFPKMRGRSVRLCFDFFV